MFFGHNPTDSSHIFNYKLLFQSALQTKGQIPRFEIYRYFKFPITVISVKIHSDLKTDLQVLLSNGKLTGRKRIAFDNNVHKIAIFSDELENHCRVPDKEWSFQDGGLYIIKKVGVKILTIIVLYRLSQCL